MPQDNTPTDTAIPGSTATSNKISAPKVGDTLYVLAKPYGGMNRIISEDAAVKYAENGDTVLTVEVKSVKTAMISLSEAEVI